MIAAGSKGPTLQQLLSFLKSKSNEQQNFASELVAIVFADGSANGGPRLSVANGVWIDQSLSFKNTFKQTVDNIYKASSHQVDFQNKAVEVSREINFWAEKETNGFIKEVLPPGSVDDSSKLVFANALYFKGVWNEAFDSSKTKEYDFHLLNGGSIKVPFMTSKNKQLVTAFDGFKVLVLPYKQALEKKTGSQSGFLKDHIPYEMIEVGDFRIPRFKISFGIEVSRVLKALGLVLSFSRKGGRLTEMVDSHVGVGENLYFSGIFQKSFIEVKEEGTEAAAASAAVITLKSLPRFDKIDFVADHPFIFMIREDATGVVLSLVMFSILSIINKVVLHSFAPV
ncbi:serpin-ZX [Citrus sinensis]|uniref:Serpin-ZX n=1 Tax=Citrus sinensis TaxID=2711 RepID=A0ACB8KVH6_CITSI|nr:serpin-ZX [Citrus sinensis]